MPNLDNNTKVKLPDGFTGVDNSLPDNDKPVLACRISGYQSAEFEILTARYMPAYRPRAPWQTIAMDNVGDSGEQILGWCYANELFNPN